MRLCPVVCPDGSQTDPCWPSCVEDDDPVTVVQFAPVDDDDGFDW